MFISAVIGDTRINKKAHRAIETETEREREEERERSSARKKAQCKQSIKIAVVRFIYYGPEF